MYLTARCPNPKCRWEPANETEWQCENRKCSKSWNTFETLGMCSKCGHEHENTYCYDCEGTYPLKKWIVPNERGKMTLRVRCPGTNCSFEPVAGTIWKCQKCPEYFNIFSKFLQCPHCGLRYDKEYPVSCEECKKKYPFKDWVKVVKPMSL